MAPSPFCGVEQCNGLASHKVVNIHEGYNTTYNLCQDHYNEFKETIGKKEEHYEHQE